jgi:hypothetical protein
MNTVEIPLTQGEIAIVDACDASRVLRHKWHVCKQGRQYYAATNAPRRAGKQRRIWLHRLVLGTSPGTEIDHKNGDGLDNRRANLRRATRTQNNGNSRLRLNSKSKLKGVHFYKARHKWCARIQVNGCGKYLGEFATREEAATAYDRAARELFGEFARPNACMISLYRLEKNMIVAAKFAIQRGAITLPAFVTLAQNAFKIVAREGTPDRQAPTSQAALSS